MRIIELSALPNGAHRNQEGDCLAPPEGWAVIPDAIEIPASFPFVTINVDEDGAVTGLTAAAVPEPEPAVVTPTRDDDQDALLIDLEYRLTLLELGVV